MNDKKQTLGDTLYKIAKKKQPDLYKRTEGIARIIDPGVFTDGWIIHPEDTERLFHSRRKLEQCNALAKAQGVLKFLGVNTDTDWYDVLTEFQNGKT